MLQPGKLLAFPTTVTMFEQLFGLCQKAKPKLHLWSFFQSAQASLKQEIMVLRQFLGKEVSSLSFVVTLRRFYTKLKQNLWKSAWSDACIRPRPAAASCRHQWWCRKQWSVMVNIIWHIKPSIKARFWKIPHATLHPFILSSLRLSQSSKWVSTSKNQRTLCWGFCCCKLGNSLPLDLRTLWTPLLSYFATGNTALSHLTGRAHVWHVFPTVQDTVITFAEESRDKIWLLEEWKL